MAATGSTETQTIKTEKHINGEVVWYKNKWKNFWLKLKHFFKKPKYLKYLKKYHNIKSNPLNYKTINMTNEKNDN